MNNGMEHGGYNYNSSSNVTKSIFGNNSLTISTMLIRENLDFHGDNDRVVSDEFVHWVEEILKGNEHSFAPRRFLRVVSESIGPLGGMRRLVDIVRTEMLSIKDSPREARNDSIDHKIEIYREKRLSIYRPFANMNRP
ncbi:hypothetical protein PFISCL1PPCAC_20306, partial [Pristionchus fissidentatus]